MSLKKLYMVSLGPGDYELVTIKALKALQNSDIICVPTKSKDNSFKKSITYKIVKSLMSEFDFDKKIIPIYSPMRFRIQDWQREVDLILQNFENNNIVSFVTLGDSGVYSSVYYLLNLIKTQSNSIYKSCEVIPGITSFSQASARVKKPLCIGDSRFEIVPLLNKSVPTTTIYMRPKIGMDSSIIKESGDIYTFENINLENENIQNSKKKRVEKYMTLFIDFVN